MMPVSDSRYVQQGIQRQGSDNSQVDDRTDRPMLFGHEVEHIQIDLTNVDDDTRQQSTSCSITMDNGTQVDPNLLEVRLLSQVTDIN
jgi:hypothetical protein